MAVTVITNLGQAAFALNAASPTIRSLAAGPGRFYRHPDSAQISYPLTVETPLGGLAAGDTSVAIIGAGPAGIAALYELRQIANANRGRNIHVTIFETDPANFMFQKPRQAVLRAGRVSAYCTEETVYEIGAMRFPSIAGLTWHYAARAFDPDEVVTAFPNPGTVPTEFVFGSRFDHYEGEVWLDENSPTKKVRDLVLAGLIGPTYMIGKRTPSDVSILLQRENTKPDDLKEIQSDWGNFVRKHDGTTLEAAVRQILTMAMADGKLPTVPGLTGDQLLDWCVELFGRFGFGTGGFKPLYNISLVEMMRLVLWQYNNEYTFPPKLAPGNVDFIAKLQELAAKPSANFSMTPIQARVTDVFHRAAPRAAGVAYCPAGGGVMTLTNFDYAIIAVPHDAATAMVNRLGYSPQPLKDPQIGDIGNSARPGYDVLPGLLLSTKKGEDAVNARAVTAVSMLHMTRSSKIFATITKQNATAAPVPKFGSGPISAVISDCGLAATYMVPSPTYPDKFRSFLVSYTWDDDSTKIEHAFARWPQNIENETMPMFTAMLNRAYRQDPDPEKAQSKWWLHEVLSKAEQSNRLSFDWSTYLTSGGFKLDMTGDHNQSDLCFRYHTLAKESALDSRVFIASCSFSHLGGWLEGAFMSAVNAVAGIVVSINKGSTESLNSEARKLFDTLTPVIPMK